MVLHVKKYKVNVLIEASPRQFPEANMNVEQTKTKVNIVRTKQS